MDHVLATDRLVLRPVTPADHAGLLAHWTAPQVRQLLFDGEVLPAADITRAIDDSAASFGPRRAWSHDPLPQDALNRQPRGLAPGRVAVLHGEQLPSLQKGVGGMQPGQRPQRYPLTRHEAEVAQQMVDRAAKLARDSHARTRHAAVLVTDGSLVAWGTNGVPLPGEDHCYCKAGEFGNHDRCRTHAEQRAIMLARQGDGWRRLTGSTLVYVRLEADDSVRLAEPHFCARCARLALSLGVAQWIFALSEGLVGYSSPNYDAIAQLSW